MSDKTYLVLDVHKDNIPDNELDIIRKNDNWTIKESKYGGGDWITISKDLVTKGLVKQYFPRVVNAVEQAVNNGYNGIEFENTRIESDDKWGWTKRPVSKGGNGWKPSGGGYSSGPKGFNVLVGYEEGFKEHIDEVLARDPARHWKESSVSIVNVGTATEPESKAYYVIKEEKFLFYSDLNKKEEAKPLENMTQINE